MTRFGNTPVWPRAILESSQDAKGPGGGGSVEWHLCSSDHHARNGFTYHLQELADFLWFYGAPSVGIHGWFSDNGTFLQDEGLVCEEWHAKWRTSKG